MAKILGGWEVASFNGVKCNNEQEAASAWAAFDGSGLTGASYRPLLYCAKQLVHGTNYGFIAEQTLVTAEPERHVVKIILNEFDVDGEKKLAMPQVEVLF